MRASGTRNNDLPKRILNELSNRLSIQAGLAVGSNPVTIVINENNKDMEKFFLRAARLAKVAINIERLNLEPAIQETPSMQLTV